jgi:hypothetical protein
VGHHAGDFRAQKMQEKAFLARNSSMRKSFIFRRSDPVCTADRHFCNLSGSTNISQQFKFF